MSPRKWNTTGTSSVLPCLKGITQNNGDPDGCLSPETSLRDLPESCVASVLEYMDPQEICKVVVLNRTFRGASYADFVFRAVLSILNDFIAFFTACNRHQLRKEEIKFFAHTKSDSRPLPDYAPTTEYNLVFTDQYQFLMLSQGSLDELNSQLEEPLPVNHFRPREWNTWLEPNETLMKFQSDKILQLSTRHYGKVYFGQGLVCNKDSFDEFGGMILKVGDAIHVEKVFASYAEAIA
ncbi:hypothetical protein DCAR_0416790 [Daucus carota subsp. sativus]|uniref:F-box domain-containing protein n=1 Tax=Daucus carota subsp. sativus TaxID=79200 RepID=A0AAF0X0L7_DAUCS|nr:hypothetical protein DCAR_0416790 [Daucus carota subsp. sativus]